MPEATTDRAVATDRRRDRLVGTLVSAAANGDGSEHVDVGRRGSCTTTFGRLLIVNETDAAPIAFRRSTMKAIG